METPIHLTHEQLQGGLAVVEASPRDGGRVEAIAVRPASNERRRLDQCRFTREEGALGDRWAMHDYLKLPDGPNPAKQVSIMNSRFIDLIAGDESRWALAGDNLFVDFELSYENLAPGTRIAAGEVVLEITDEPHNGCGKFAERYGKDAARYVNSPDGKRLNLRGIFAKVVENGVIRVGDEIRKLAV